MGTRRILIYCIRTFVLCQVVPSVECILIKLSLSFGVLLAVAFRILVLVEQIKIAGIIGIIAGI